MAKKHKKHLPVWCGYPTLGNLVHLGICLRRTRENAMKAGLTPITADQMRKLRGKMQAIERFDRQGEWYDTVKY